MTPYELAKSEVGTMEWAEGSNPKVVAYYRDAGFPEVKDDAVAWCAAFVGAMIKRAGGKPSGSLAARSYLKWGKPVALLRNARRHCGFPARQFNVARACRFLHVAKGRNDPSFGRQSARCGERRRSARSEIARRGSRHFCACQWG